MNDQAKAGKPVVLTIAGFDPSGGAGTIADIRTIESMECRAVAAITSLTFQNAEKFFGASHQTAAGVRAQILPIVAEHQIAAVKIGMLPTSKIVIEMARLIAEGHLPAPVIDPVMRSTSGYELADPDAIEALLTELMPLARLVTPNIPEAEQLTGLKITNEEEMCWAGARLRELNVSAVLVKGGHLAEAASNGEQLNREAIDVLDDGGQVTVFRDEWIAGNSLRGTGCMLSAATAACLAQKKSLDESVRVAKKFVADAIRQAQN